ncbi:piggybac transposable element-derived protein 4 [Holotrichia oblita]|uniref:Piggybac transposable element-derived protein 4 n=1 Tax=Holotrichia oblita TaxID=644536 RepID=A0ACB9TYV1_HOLOL|nr:piggybac transposable element-derived protein 4 [Holotrichia oblita]
MTLSVILFYIFCHMKVILGKDGTHWKKDPPKISKTRPHNVVTKLPGVEGQDARNAKTELECWNLFFTEIILNLLVQWTNQHIENVREKFGRERDCRPTNKAEIKAFLGLLYLAGVFRGARQRLSDFWATDGLGIHIFRMTMSEKRFRFLIRCLRFDNRNTRDTRRQVDKLAAVRELFTVFVENCQKHYNLAENVTIDEMLPGFRGRCSFRQYIPSKPNNNNNNNNIQFIPSIQ